ncbi:MAG: hypothetical protein KME46_31625 [Brasilonema angustatum HA4187-MV1]|nr:hypothetical protein [Brasilonema angustatum HA4187-MV1]
MNRLTITISNISRKTPPKSTLVNHSRTQRAAAFATLMIVNVANAAEARTFIDNEPFHKAGVFELVRVRRWRQMQPEVVPGVNGSTAQEARLQLKELRLKELIV